VAVSSLLLLATALVGIGHTATAPPAPPSATAAQPATSGAAPEQPPPPTAASSPASPSPPSATVVPPPTTTDPPAAEAAPDPGVVAQATSDPSNTISIDKTNTADGEPARDDTTAQPGDSYTYNFLASCSNINVDCVNLTVVDTIPSDVVVDESTIPSSIAGLRTVTWVAATRTLSVLYVQPLSNPQGATGKVAGTSDSFSVGVTLPADTPLETGDVIHNEATISAGNVAQPATDPSDVIVDIPRVVAAGASKSFSDPSAIAGDPTATTTIHLGGVNQSSNSAEVTSMTIEDSTAATFEYLDFTSATVTQYPAGADQAQLYVCPEASAPCDESEWVAGGTGTPPGPSSLSLPALPAPVPAGQVVGVRVVFTAADGSFIENGTGGTAAVDIGMDLRDTVRSTGQPIVEIPTTTTIDNQSTVTVTDPGADPTTATATASGEYQVLPPTLNIQPSKSFFADGNGNYSTDNGEHAVIGEGSGVSMNITAQNISAFPIAEIVIQEPSGDVPSEFDKVDADSIRLTFPAGAANANVVVTYDDNTSTNTDYPAPGPGDVALHPPAARVTSITVTYTGPDADGDGQPDPTIDAQATAGLGVHGNLNAGVDAGDVTDGVTNCAHIEGSGGGVPGTTGTFAGNTCATLSVEARNPATGGDKTASETTIAPGQPVAFRLSTSNTGNLPLSNVVVADPPLNPDGTPPLTPAFENLRFLDATIANDNVQAPITLDVFIPGQGWVPFPGPSDAALALVTGVRATVPVLAPTESFDLLVEMQARFFAGPNIPIDNCYGITGSDSQGVVVADQHCSPPLTPADATEGATLNKAISPEDVPERIPGTDPADSAATVQLRLQNTGTLTAQFLQVTDNDADFWDAVDFASLGAITPPATGATVRADRIQIDAFVNGAWVNGTPTPIGSAALPSGVTPGQVRGLRFTFSSTLTINDGYVITPCNDDPLGGCAGTVEFVVEPRLSLLSTGGALPDTLQNTATGSFDTQLTPGTTDIPPATDDLHFVPGSPQLDVDKTPENVTVQPGQLATFTLVTTNNGTANLPDVTVSDPLPTGILFDDTYADSDTGQPFTVTWSNLPDGFPQPPPAVFETTPDPTDPTRVGLLRWTFRGFEMPPNATVTIFFRYNLQPGVTAGEQITNTMGASSPVDGLACTAPDPVVVDGSFGPGTYCTDPANVTVTAGANFASRKWVAGNPDLGWYNVSTGQLVPVGGGGCLSLTENGRTYTTNPCIALVNPGEQFFYVLRVQNAGTESALQMTIVDKFPAPGDTGVAGADRGTQWATAPTLAGPATYNGIPAGEIQYTTGAPCAGGLADWPCDDADWTAPPGSGATGLRMIANFAPDLLPPGGTVDVSFTMTTPVDVPHVSDPTIAWNSIAHSEITQPAPGQTRDLPPLEPLKVGVATMYGNLQVIKQIGENPGNLPLDDVDFTFTYQCTLTNGSPAASGTVEATPTTPGEVTDLPAGATCEVWESDTRGGISSATEADPAEVVIRPSLDPGTPVVSSVTVTNDFPLAHGMLLKSVTEGVQNEFTAGPYLFTVNCTHEGESIAGFPLAVELFPGVPVGRDLPVGSDCTVVERDVPTADTVTYDPPNANGTAAEVVVPANADATVTVTATNTYEVGSLVIRKEVSGPGVPALSGGPFVFDVTCGYNGADDVFSTSVTVEGSSDGSPVESQPVTGLPVGASCTVTETDSGRADSIPPPQTVTIEANQEANVAFVTFSNVFSAGSISVVKRLDGTDAGSSEVTGLRFTIVVQCAVQRDGQQVSVVDDEVTVAGNGSAVPVTDDSGNPILVPLGAHCWGSEPDSQGATRVTIDHDSYDTGVEVVADPDAVQPLQITVTNTFDPSGGATLSALAFTGTTIGTLLAIAAALLLTGIALFACTRRSHRRA
jgi:uncharacterized repeat protein (TIGR01451 family)